MKRLPVLFLSHGSPMQAVDAGDAGRAWSVIAKSLPRPKTILMVSAHWETDVPLVTGSGQPSTIHDFGGFPPELYRIRYPAAGSPEVAARTVELLKQADIAAGVDGTRGLDHGAWVPLLYMYPEADVPVVQLSIQPARGTAHHVRLGRAIAPLAEEGVLIVASGHITHNLRDWMTAARRGSPLAYVQAFSDWVADTLAHRDEASLVDYRDRAPEAERAHPTDEHFLPLHVAFGAASRDAVATRVHNEIFQGALSMDAYEFRPAA